jgi:cell wall-associated NlpC family hydrolase
MSGILATALYCYKHKKDYDGKFDCSGFVKYCYSENGIKNVPSSSKAIWENGKPGDGSAGDIACWEGHDGICDGMGNVIHSYHDGHLIVAHTIKQVSQPKWSGTLKGYRRF